MERFVAAVQEIKTLTILAIVAELCQGGGVKLTAHHNPLMSAAEKIDVAAALRKAADAMG